MLHATNAGLVWVVLRKLVVPEPARIGSAEYRQQPVDAGLHVFRWRHNLGQQFHVLRALRQPDQSRVFETKLDAGGGRGDEVRRGLGRFFLPPRGDSNLPAPKAKGGLPAGGNEVFIDGSAPWVKAKDMRFVHQFSGAKQREFYFYQEDLGGLEPLRNALARFNWPSRFHPELKAPDPMRNNTRRFRIAPRAPAKHVFDSRNLTSLKPVWEDRKWIGGV